MQFDKVKHVTKFVVKKINFKTCLRKKRMQLKFN